MSTLPLINMIHVAKEQCAIAWERVEEISAHMARKRITMKPKRTVIFNKDKLDKISKNTQVRKRN